MAGFQFVLCGYADCRHLGCPAWGPGCRPGEDLGGVDLTAGERETQRGAEVPASDGRKPRVGDPEHDEPSLFRTASVGSGVAKA
jgi:hypothetical protein